MKNEYDYFIWLDPNIDCYSNTIDNVVDQLKSEIRALGKIARWHKKFSDHIRIIVLNLYNAAYIDRNCYVAYSRNKGVYTKCRNSRYMTFELSYNSMKNTVDALTELKYIKGAKGYYDRNKKNNSRTSKMIATDNLIKLGAEFTFHPTDIKRKQVDDDIIILKEKDADGNSVILPFEDTDETRRMRNNLQYINDELQKHFIGLNVSDGTLEEIKNATKGIKVKDYDHFEGFDYGVDDLGYTEEEKIKTYREKYKAPLDMTKETLVRIFCNGKFDQGGRFYGGWWQAVPGRYRPYIAIDDKPTIEIDFSGVHINMLYLREGLPIPTDDVYTIDSFPDEIKKVVRNVMKIALQIILNSKSENKALWTMRTHKKINSYVNLFKVITHKEILTAFKEKHKAIEKYFFSGIGVFLQFEDSQIAEDILLKLVKKGIIALPIHDSFVVQEEHEGALRDAMNEACQGKYGQVIKLKADKSAFEIDRDFLAWNLPSEDVPLTQVEYESEWISILRYDYISRRDQWKSGRVH